MTIRVHGLKRTGQKRPTSTWDFEEWQHIWLVASVVCRDLLSLDQINRGFDNIGVKISQDQAIRIAERLNRITNCKSTAIVQLELGPDPGESTTHTCPLCRGVRLIRWRTGGGKCILCGGGGILPGPNIQFVDLLKGFVKFCYESEGFDIR